MARARNTNQTPKKVRKDWAIKFLATLSKTGNVCHSAKLAGIARCTAYVRKEADPEFHNAWENALEDSVQLLELEARRRALEGTNRPVFNRGVKCGTIREYSDTLTIFLLKAHRPDKYRDNLKHEHTGKDGGAIPISIVETVRPTEDKAGKA